MNVRNFLSLQLTPEQIHDGKGLCPHCGVFRAEDFETPLRFLNYTVIPEGASFGIHQHADDNELYIVLEGSGVYTENGEQVPVKEGDIIVNARFTAHGIENTGKIPMRLLVIEAYNK